ncbi:hypothetical protein L5515_014352 [Caenorhabditis briggsae]|uniref:Uncharacterized protein n=1 Tax=Caenorhabditis briggsae TaxID=6238 RepID=A0AAE9DLA1_CAEBR|nr:hypothetical protein L3Y34_018229 [Caenorhabditis briggsae]UMM18159.1 hypothetical protein L5515_014352 [Caenorhabditis briggsae]
MISVAILGILMLTIVTADPAEQKCEKRSDCDKDHYCSDNVCVEKLVINIYREVTTPKPKAYQRKWAIAQ